MNNLPTKQQRQQENGQESTISSQTSWFLQYWYKISNTSLMMMARTSTIKPEDGPAYLFSTSFPASTLKTDFARRFSLVPWMTYRQWSHNDPIDGFYTDCGWGCMLRTAQMMLAEGLFRLESPNGSSMAPLALREKILKQFIDRPGSAYSVHEMFRRAKRFGKRAGQWFEPTLTLLVVAEILQQQDIRAIVAMDSVLDVSSLIPSEEEMQAEKEDEQYFDPLSDAMVTSKPKPVLLFVPLRLGMREINEQSYGKALALALRFPQSIGMIGGKPGRSLYFCGSQPNTNKLVYLDPHTVQNTDPFDLHSFQCHEALVMPISEVDPSLALGFLVYSYQDFVDLQKRVAALPGSAMFSFSTKPLVAPNDEDFAFGEEDGEEEFEKVAAPNVEEEDADDMAGFPPPLSATESSKRKEDFVLL